MSPPQFVRHCILMRCFPKGDIITRDVIFFMLSETLSSFYFKQSSSLIFHFIFPLHFTDILLRIIFWTFIGPFCYLFKHNFIYPLILKPQEQILHILANYIFYFFLGHFAVSPKIGYSSLLVLMSH